MNQNSIFSNAKYCMDCKLLIGKEEDEKSHQKCKLLSETQAIHFFNQKILNEQKEILQAKLDLISKKNVFDKYIKNFQLTCNQLFEEVYKSIEQFKNASYINFKKCEEFQDKMNLNISEIEKIQDRINLLREKFDKLSIHQIVEEAQSLNNFVINKKKEFVDIVKFSKELNDDKIRINTIVGEIHLLCCLNQLKTNIYSDDNKKLTVLKKTLKIDTWNNRFYGFKCIHGNKIPEEFLIYYLNEFEPKILGNLYNIDKLSRAVIFKKGFFYSIVRQAF